MYKRILILLIGLITIFLSLDLSKYKVQAEATYYQNNYFDWKVSISNLLNENMLLSNGKVYTGNNIRVGVLDTGIDYNNKGLYVQGGISTVNNTDDYIDTNGHGTHVAGIISSSVIHKDKTIGVAPKAQLFAIKSMDNKGHAREESIIAGVQWAIDHDIDILNMSIGSEIDSKGVREILEKAYDDGMFIVAPVGNSDYPTESSINYPAKYNTVLAVGSVNTELKRSFFSNIGPELDIVALGEEIYGPNINNTYTYETGTSVASPYVAGVAALLLSANKDLTNDDLKEILILSANYLGNKNEYGNGIINIPGALNLALLKKENSNLYNYRINLYKSNIVYRKIL
ncbi:S8 family peptidase [Priestia filamentosa]|uniref:S8 family peptidase n=1 Tax=Priestia filamentosa TaxID=1402861 RepID=UPI002E22D36E|nr:S8 family peptidase [Priestia filamentosa]